MVINLKIRETRKKTLYTRCKNTLQRLQINIKQIHGLKFDRFTLYIKNSNKLSVRKR